MNLTPHVYLCIRDTGKGPNRGPASLGTKKWKRLYTLIPCFQRCMSQHVGRSDCPLAAPSMKHNFR